ncbi:AraC family transcriptional regulator [Allopusillimonas soli]|uniref:Helix-turn-helix transcriptional regulator n=1 Tax=Allopusillimonas soli TaxID=659016 RepID=A0A853FGT6_9BURK|nr:helix-turn-helix transcriptional regulator [Allopusillimonas soli]NYT39079.1 helix-turn-helix transcriptional regulator [Allopusillimonas soli]TEA69321.1 AraC family transcriptional regulator [Allopusillimonas soli]
MGAASTVQPAKSCGPDTVAASELPVTGIAIHYPQGHVVPMHQHQHGHLIYASQGLLRVEAETGQWLVPPTSAVWLRPEVAHRLIVPVALQAHGLFIRKDICANLPTTDCVVQVSGLLRETITELTCVDYTTPLSRRTHLLSELLLEELNTPPALPFHLPWPQDAQIQNVCHQLMGDPSHQATAGDWASTLAIGEKTFHRRFVKSTGMTFGKWRQQLRLMSSLTQLMQGAPITQVALNSGYDSHSAYTTAFKKQFGHAPSEFIQRQLVMQ